MDNHQSPSDLTKAKAWEQMKNLLDAEMPEKVIKSQNNNSKYVALLLLLISGCGVYKLYNSYNASGVIPGNNAIVQNSKTRVNRGAQHSDISTSSKVADLVTSLSKGNIKSNREISKTTIFRNHSSQEHQKNNNSFAGTSVMKAEEINTKNFVTLINEMPTATTIKADKSDLISEKNSLHKIDRASAIQNSNSADNNHEAITNENHDHSTLAKALLSDTIARLNQLNTNKEKLAKANIKETSSKSHRTLHAGLEWTVPLQFGNNIAFINVNGKRQPLIVLIPSAWISKSLSKKSTLLLSVNPYAQYFLSNQSSFETGNYVINAVPASNINQPTTPVLLAQTSSVYKVTGMEINLNYAFSLSQKWAVGIGVGNTWTNTALLNEKIVKNKTVVLKDSLYGVVSADKEWQYIRKSFATGKINVAYNLKHYQLGATLSKSLTDIYRSTDEHTQPVNVQLFLRWLMK